MSFRACHWGGFDVDVVFRFLVFNHRYVRVMRKFQGKELRQLDEAICAEHHARQKKEEKSFLESVGVKFEFEQQCEACQLDEKATNEREKEVLPMQVEMKDMKPLLQDTPNGDELDASATVELERPSQEIVDFSEEQSGESDDLIFPGRVLYLERQEDTTIRPHILQNGMHPILRFLPVSSQTMLKHHHIRNVGEALLEAIDYAKDCRGLESSEADFHTAD